MTIPEITQEKLDRLMDCLVAEFENKHSAQINKLGAHEFNLTNCMGCAKTAGLNYEYPSVFHPENMPVTVYASEYVSAIDTLEGQGFVKPSLNNPLIFHLTELGFSETKLRNTIKNRTRIEKFLYACKEHPVAVSLIIALIGFTGIVIKTIFG